ncbi:MAG TPA: hypothetical protein VLM79_13140 [Kofleriaceae bacterium]|nr:hypothetical protein [Kofleriaceae bacterium]
MRSNVVQGILITAAMAAVMAAAAPAEAAPERKLLVLIDASPSMLTPRDNSDGNGATRWEAAKAFAKIRINTIEGQADTRPLRVAVYTFQGLDALPVVHTDSTVNSGFGTANAARHVIDCMVDAPPATCADTPDGGAPFAFDPAGGTPLARGMCRVVEIFAPFTADGRLLQVSSDGEENTTTSPPCAGTTGTFNGTSYDPPDAWQNKIINAFTGQGIITHTDLFEVHNLPFARLQMTPDPEGFATPEARAFAAAPGLLDGLTPLEQFFTLLAQVTGGSVTVVHDDAPLPLVGDNNEDGCVDHNDAIPVARAFGPIAPPKDGTFDFNADRKVGFADYAFQLSLINPSCGFDPYTPSAPINCVAGTVTLDGKSIENGGITINTTGACRVIIKNSLIVSGAAAIKVLGTAIFEIDNSIIVGEAQWLNSTGASVVSAANTVFHGARKLVGAFVLLDRGGNTFE